MTTDQIETSPNQLRAEKERARKRLYKHRLQYRLQAGVVIVSLNKDSPVFICARSLRPVPSLPGLNGPLDRARLTGIAPYQTIVQALEKEIRETSERVAAALFAGPLEGRILGDRVLFSKQTARVFRSKRLDSFIVSFAQSEGKITKSVVVDNGHPGNYIAPFKEENLNPWYEELSWSRGISLNLFAALIRHGLDVECNKLAAEVVP
jgi:hypothetical protein